MRFVSYPVDGLGAVGKQSAGARRRRSEQLALLLAAWLLGHAAAPVHAVINVTTYPFSTGSGAALEDLSVGSTALVGPNSDDAASVLTAIGFDFWLNGIRHTQFAASSNGFVRLGAAIIGSGASNDLASGSNAPMIVPYWDDLRTGTNGAVRSKVVGTAPARKLVIEWLNLQVPKGVAGATGAATYQAWLHEASGQIEFVYGPGVAANAGGYSAGFGVVGSFASVSTAGPSVSHTTADNTQTGPVAIGTRYTFSPPVPANPSASLTFTGVTASAMTLNWIDNATNEVGYAVYRSTDGINFTFVTLTGANVTASNQTGLAPGASYSWNVYAVSEGALSVNPAAGTGTTTAPSFAGTKAIGPGGNYTSLTAAFAAINTDGLAGPAVLELQPNYVSSAETFPISPGLLLGNSSVRTVTVRPSAGASARAITTSNSTATFNLDATMNLVLDGRPGGTGTVRDMRIENTSVSGAALRLVNEARNNTFRYLNVRGVNTGTNSGVVYFSSTGVSPVNGNDDNLVEFCDIGAGATQPTNLICSLGTTTTTATQNSGNTIASCNLFDFFNPASTSAAVALLSGSTGWTIRDNHVYQTAPRALTGAINHAAFYVQSGSDHVITGNTIGGSGPGATGGPWTVTSGTVGGRFYAIDLSLAAGGATSVQGNTITNFSYASSFPSASGGGIFSGINVTTGDVNVGNQTGNTIGAPVGTGAITVTTTSGTGGGAVNLINSSSNGAIIIQNNRIGSVTTAGAPAISTGITGIQLTGNGGSCVVDGNLIGSLTTPHSLHASTVATSTTTTQRVRGISLGHGPAGVVTNNTVANLTNAYSAAPSSPVSLLTGIETTTGTSTIASNTVRDLTCASPSPGTGLNAALTGISEASFSAGQVLRGNTVHSLASSAASGAVNVLGVVVLGPSTVERNFVHSIAPAPGNAATSIVGIFIAGAGIPTLVQNNMVRLGIDAAGAVIPTGCGMTGIHDNGGGNSYYHNTVYIAGTGVAASTANTFALNSLPTTVARSFVDNLLWNARSNAAGTARHYAIGVGGTAPNPAGLLSNFNDLYATGTGNATGRFAGVDRLTLSDWRAATGQDAASVAGDPRFPAPENPAASVDLHINPVPTSAIEGTGTLVPGVVEDFDGETRAGLSPVDIGADAGDFSLGCSVFAFTPGTLPDAPVGVAYSQSVAVTGATPPYSFLVTAGALPPGLLLSPAGLLSGTPSGPGLFSFTVSVADVNSCAGSQNYSVRVIAPLEIAAAAPPATCVSTATPCVVIPVNIARSDVTPMRGYSVTVQLSANLSLCGSITESTYLAAAGSTVFLVTPHGGGEYVVDGAILGTPCGATGAAGTLFSVPVTSTDPGGVGTVVLTNVTVRDCVNDAILASSGAPAMIDIDRVPPAPIADLAAVQQRTGNPLPPPTTRIAITWSAVEPGAAVTVYRRGFGGYPDYDEAGGVEPMLPATPAAAIAAGWAAVSVTASGQIDRPLSRDFWYYVAFVTDPCGNVSAVSNRTNGTLGYHLGDFHDGTASCIGDNVVTTADMSFLGAHYGAVLTPGDPNACLDIGPTTSSTVSGRPTTDHRIQFEDLILAAINYGTVSKARIARSAAPQNVLSVGNPVRSEAGTWLVPLVLGGDGQIQGLSITFECESHQRSPRNVVAGDWLVELGGVALVPAPNTVDLALLGSGAPGFSGSGVVAELVFEANGTAPPHVSIVSADGRNSINAPVQVAVSAAAAPAVPVRTDLFPNVPNPFNPSTQLRFDLAQEGWVELAVFGANGHRVRTLIRGERVAGRYACTWNGTDETGRPVSSGAYFVRLRAPGTNRSQSIVLLK